MYCQMLLLVLMCLLVVFFLQPQRAQARRGRSKKERKSQGPSVLEGELHLTARGAPAIKCVTCVVRGPKELTPVVVRGPKELTPGEVRGPKELTPVGVRGPKELASWSVLECLVLKGGLRNFAR